MRHNPIYPFRVNRLDQKKKKKKKKKKIYIIKASFEGFILIKM